MLGRSTCVPLVKLNPGMDESPKLLWEPVMHKNAPAGEVLVAAELILKTKVWLFMEFVSIMAAVFPIKILLD